MTRNALATWYVAWPSEKGVCSQAHILGSMTRRNHKAGAKPRGNAFFQIFQGRLCCGMIFKVEIIFVNRLSKGSLFYDFRDTKTLPRRSTCIGEHFDNFYDENLFFSVEDLT